MKTPVYDYLVSYSKSKMLRMHMPGHKGRRFESELSEIYRFDITEITGAGNLFALIKECLSTNFSYESVKNLLLEDNLPWIEKELAEELVAFGQNNHCICSFEYKGKFIDVWKESMKVQQMDEMLKKFYLLFNSSLEKFKNAFKVQIEK